MGLLNKIKDMYRILTGKMSIQEEADYRKWSGYSGKLKKASKGENLAINAALQASVYEREGKLVKALEHKKKYQSVLREYKLDEKIKCSARNIKKDILSQQYDSNLNSASHGIHDRRFKVVLSSYVKAYYWDVPIQKQKQIYLNLFNLYKEVYEDTDPKEVENLEDKLIEITAKARRKRENAEYQRRTEYRSKRLEALAAA